MRTVILISAAVMLVQRIASALIRRRSASRLIRRWRCWCLPIRCFWLVRASRNWSRLASVFEIYRGPPDSAN